MIYLDNNASTKVDPNVLAAMMPYFTDSYGNASSNHQFGVEINQAVKTARAKIASLIKAEANEIIFTSGATEAINLALKGLVQTRGTARKHIITVSTEHPAMLDTCKFLEKNGFEVTYLPVQANGLLDISHLSNAMREDTLLVAVMMVNNETGIIQPIKEISQLAHANGSIFMTDATQAVGKIAIDVDDLGIDILAMSAHKFYGPKGIGALFVRNRKPLKVKLSALIHGGGHERSLRSGTLNVPGIVGMGTAAEIAMVSMTPEEKKIKGLRDYIEKELLKIENTALNGDPTSRLYNVSSIVFTGVDADAMIIALKDVALSNGSACSSTSIEPSHVLKAMGLSDEDAFSTIRFSFGKFNTKEEVESVILQVAHAVKSLRAMISA